MIEIYIYSCIGNEDKEMKWFTRKSNTKHHPSSMKEQSILLFERKPSELEKRTIASLEKAENGELASIPSSYHVFAYNDLRLQLETARRLNDIVNRLDVNQISKLDLMFRDRTSMEWSIDWKTINLNLNIPGMTEDQKITVLGLGTFNPNGYFRQRCLVQLLKYNDVKAYRFVCLRLRDWVFDIRKSARNILIALFSRETGLNLLELIPYLNKIKQSCLNEPFEIIELLTVSLSDKTDLVKEGVLSKHIEIKRFCYQILLQITEESEYLFNRIEKEKDVISKRMILKKMLENTASEELLRRLPLLLTNRSTEIRRLSMNRLFELKPKYAVETLKNMLLDRSIAIRDEARYLLNKIEKVDYRQYYIAHLGDVGSLFGLGETGLKEDAALLLTFLHSNDPRLVIAAMSAIANLSPEEFTGQLIEKLASISMSISKCASRHLQKINYMKYVGEIHRLFISDVPLYIRKNCALLLKSLSKWDAIQYILEMIADKEKDIAVYGESAYLNWVRRFNRSYRTPTRIQIQSFRDALNLYRNNLADNRVEYLNFLLSAFKDM